MAPKQLDHVVTSRKSRPGRGGLAQVMLAAGLTLLLPAFPASVAGAGGRGLSADQKILHLLSRAGYGARPGDLEHVRRMGLNRYLEEQLHPERLDDAAVEARLNEFPSLTMPVDQIYAKYPLPLQLARQIGLRFEGQPQPNSARGTTGQTPQPANYDPQKIAVYYREHDLKPPQRILQELQAQKILRAVYSPRQLQEVMVAFWFNHFNVFWPKGADRWLTADYERNAIRPHALGRFKDLLLANAKSPAMLFYLDNVLSASPDSRPPVGGPRAGRPDGAARRPGAEQPLTEAQRRRLAEQRNRKFGINENYARELMELHTLGVDGGYTQKDVQEVARCLTGWSIDRPYQGSTFIFRDWMHDRGEKSVLGCRIPAGGGIEDGEKVIDILVRHPSTARFLATKLVRRFVNDQPPPKLVARVADVYKKTDGDIREMLKAIFTSREFYAAENYRAKIKSPFELAVSAIRAVGGNTDGYPRLAGLIGKMGEPLYLSLPPTGYPDRAEQWVNTGALLERLNFALALTANKIPGTTVGLESLVAPADRTSPEKILDRAVQNLLGGQIAPQTRTALARQARGEEPGLEMAAEPVMIAGGDMAMRRQAAERRGPQGAQVGNLFRDMVLTEKREMPPPVDPQIARIFGLVLGSPDFQRR